MLISNCTSIFSRESVIKNELITSCANISPTFAALYAHVTFDPQWVKQMRFFEEMPFLLRFEPDILLRAKQDFMKTDSATDLEWVSLRSFMWDPVFL